MVYLLFAPIGFDKLKAGPSQILTPSDKPVFLFPHVFFLSPLPHLLIFLSPFLRQLLTPLAEFYDPGVLAHAINPGTLQDSVR